jgi:hypothetical protein
MGLPPRNGSLERSYVAYSSFDRGPAGVFGAGIRLGATRIQVVPLTSGGSIFFSGGSLRG